MKRRYNSVVASAKKGGNEKCRTCAASFADHGKLHKHLCVKGHRRHGIIPRFAADNDRHDRMHRQGLMRSFQKYPYGSFNEELVIGNEIGIRYRHIRHAIGYKSDDILPDEERDMNE